MTALPLTPPEVDLRDFQYVPLDVMRLFQSRFHAVCSDSAWRAGVTLWLKSWHQIPAGSLPEDDIELTRLAELGRDTRAWKEVKEQALHGWIRCADGRLYHRVVAEKALEAWLKKLSHRKRAAKGNAKRWGSGVDADSIDQMIERGQCYLDSIEDHANGVHKGCTKESFSDPLAIASISISVRERENGIAESTAVECEPRTRARARATRLASDWTPPEEYVAWALQEQPTWNAQHVQRVAEMFRDYWIGKAGQQGGKLDWFATWRNWIRREKPLVTKAAMTTTLNPATVSTIEAGKRWLEKETENARNRS